MSYFLAPKYGALLVFAEHRYFGESLPFGDKSFERNNIGYLNTDQALADYAVLITSLQKNTSSENCPVFAFGGSYGGMLTTWFRQKYPQIVMGGLAASAPFGFYGSGIPPSAFSLATTNTFETSAAGCSARVEDFWRQFQSQMTTQSGRNAIASSMKLCSVPATEAEAAAVMDWVIAGLSDMAMLDYPYETNYGISVHVRLHVLTLRLGLSMPPANAC